MSSSKITEVETLRQTYPEPKGSSLDKVLYELDDHCINFISKSRKRDFCRLLLLCYYDKTYAHSFESRKIKAINVNASSKSYNEIAKEVKGC